MDLENPKTRAIAIDHNKIIYVGSNAGVESFIADNTKVLDAGGKLVLPEFNDNYVHFESTCRIIPGLNLMDVHAEDPYFLLNIDFPYKKNDIIVKYKKRKPNNGMGFLFSRESTVL